jgi:hypothetical protein
MGKSRDPSVNLPDAERWVPAFAGTTMFDYDP